MIVLLSFPDHIELVNPWEFDKFKLVVGAARNKFVDLQASFAGRVDFVDLDRAWVHIEILKAISPSRDSELWLSKFENMVRAAEPHGWIDRSTRAIKAHIEWGNEVDR